MNRFRKRSQAKRKADQEQAELAKLAAAPQLSSLPTGDFRTSLILPHLTKRFTLLRSEDGSLVSLDTMESHLALQRETGRLTALEANAVLNQYKAQKQAELPFFDAGPPNRALQAFRRSPSTVAEEETLRNSLLSNSTLDHEPPNTGSSFGAASSSIPFPYATELASPNSESSSSPLSPPVYKRGGNSMFGGRVASFAVMNMSKSPSTNSLRSASSRKARARGIDDDEGNRLGGGEDLTGSTALSSIEASDVTEELQDLTAESGMGTDLEVEASASTSAGADDSGESRESVNVAFEDAHEGLVTPELSAGQLRRISRALDDIEVELSKSYARLPAEPEADEEEMEELTGSTSESLAHSQASSQGGARNDTEPIDPFFHRLSPSPSLSHSAPKISPSPIVSSGRSTPDATPYLPALASQTPLPRPSSDSPPNRGSVASSTATRVPLVSDSESRSQDASTSALPSFSTPRATEGAVPGPSASSRGYSSASSEDLDLPGSYRFASGSTPRKEAPQTSGEIASSTRTEEDVEALVVPSISSVDVGAGSPTPSYSSVPPTTNSTPSLPRTRTRTTSTSTVASTGSSFHEDGFDKVADDDLDEQLFRSETAVSPVPEEHSSLHDDGTLFESDISHLPPSELLKELQTNQSSPLGSIDLALEDIVMIQETLVRTASKRAARRAAGDLSNSSRSPSEEIERSSESSVAGAAGSGVKTSARNEVESDAGSRSGHGTVNILRASMLGVTKQQEVKGPPAIVVEPSEEEEELQDGFRSPPLEDQMANADIPARVPRLMPLRNPTATTSVLIRDVRTQADLATHALKATTPPPQVIRRRKSIRNIPISAPQFVSGPTDIPAVPIANPILVNGGQYQSGTFNRSKSKIGLRFKMLLKKASRDDLSVPNGYEVMPFNLASLSGSTSPNDTPPITPLSQASSSSYATSPFPDRAPLRPERPERPTRAERSPAVSGHQSSSAATSPVNGNRPLGRVLPRIHRPGQDSEPNSSISFDSDSTPTSPTSSSAPHLGTQPRSPTLDGETPGLGAALSSRAPISYNVGSMRRRRELESLEIPQTAPLDLQPRTRSPTSPEMGQFGTAPLNFFSPPLSAPPEVRALSPTNRHAGASSIDSMTRLRDVAQDLGLPLRKADELAALSYNRAPPRRDVASVSSNSMDDEAIENEDSFVAASENSILTSLSTVSARASSSLTGRRQSQHRREKTRESNVSISSSHRSIRSNSTTSRSIQDRPSTPPPTSTHRRQASVQEHASAGPVPSLPILLQSPSGKGLAIDVPEASTSTRPPLASPGLKSLMSRSSSGSVYAESVFNLYMSEAAEGSIKRTSSIMIPQRGGVMGDEVEVEGDGELEGDRSGSTQVGSGEGGGGRGGLKEGETLEGDENLVWRVVGDLLRRNRTSSILSDAFSHSRQTSLDSLMMPPSPPSSDRKLPPPAPLSSAQPPFSFLRRDPTLRDSMSTAEEGSATAGWSGASTPRVPSTSSSARYPSVYVRDEKRLEALAVEGGIAVENQGHFMTRPKSRDLESEGVLLPGVGSTGVVIRE